MFLSVHVAGFDSEGVMDCVLSRKEVNAEKGIRTSAEYCRTAPV
jgi:hypothetical protein